MADNDDHKDRPSLGHERRKETREDIIDLIGQSRLEIEEWVRSAYPEGDPIAHRNFHQTLIDRATSRAEFMAEIKKKIMSAAVTGIVSTIIGVVALKYFGVHIS